MGLAKLLVSDKSQCLKLESCKFELIENKVGLSILNFQIQVSESNTSAEPKDLSEVTDINNSIGMAIRLEC